MSVAALADIVRFFRSLRGLTADNTLDRGAVIGCHDRWIFEVQPDGERWAAAARVWRDGQRVTLGWRFDTVEDLERARAELALIAKAESDRLSIHRLKRGEQYRVRQPFVDYYGHDVAAGAALTFVALHYLPHDGGYTVEFREQRIYLQEVDQGALIADFDAYVEPITAASPTPSRYARLDGGTS